MTLAQRHAGRRDGIGKVWRKNASGLHALGLFGNGLVIHAGHCAAGMDVLLQVLATQRFCFDSCMRLLSLGLRLI